MKRTVQIIVPLVVVVETDETGTITTTAAPFIDRYLTDAMLPASWNGTRMAWDDATERWVPALPAEEAAAVIRVLSE